MKDGIDVSYVAQLARLKLTADEERTLAGQLASILEYVDQLKQLNVEGIEPTAHAFPLVNVLRKDESRPGLPIDAALKNAPLRNNDLFVVPRVVEE